MLKTAVAEKPCPHRKHFIKQKCYEKITGKASMTHSTLACNVQKDYHIICKKPRSEKLSYNFETSKAKGERAIPCPSFKDWTM